jgi:hypothetical protein
MEQTCSIFTININTFDNWIRQKQYYEKWLHYVQSFTVADILSSISSSYRGNRQMKRKTASTSDTVIYIRKDTKTAASGRHVKYQEQEDFIIQHVIERWETGNPLNKSSEYDLLISHFGHELETGQMESEMKMGIHSGNITSALSQWFGRVLRRHRFSIRKESISHTIGFRFASNLLLLSARRCFVLE